MSQSQEKVKRNAKDRAERARMKEQDRKWIDRVEQEYLQSLNWRKP